MRLTLSYRIVSYHEHGRYTSTVNRCFDWLDERLYFPPLRYAHATSSLIAWIFADSDMRCGSWSSSWWRHQMETFSTLLALCAWNSPVTGEFPSHRPVTRSFDMFSLICVWTNGGVNNLDAGDLRCHRAHYDFIVMCCRKLASKCKCDSFSRQVFLLQYKRHKNHNFNKETQSTINSLRPSDAYICVGKPTIIGSDNGLSPERRHYLNQCWNIVNWALGNKLQWNFNRNSNIFIEENTVENVVCEILFISSRPQCVKEWTYALLHAR